MIKMFLDLISGAKENTDLRSLSKSLLPDIERTLKSVDNLIQDVIEVGRQTSLQATDVVLEKVIEITLKDVFRFIPGCNVSFEYSLNHSKKVFGDEANLSRVFTNIIQNATEAMENRGCIWFRTRDIEIKGVLYVEVCIGNSGPVLSKDIQPRLFDSFVTNGKKEGTGLGLAIAKKVVLEHGGNIWVGKSDRTEFYITLPVKSPQHKIYQENLPSNSQDLSQRISDIDQIANEMRNQIVPSLKVHIVDDEPLYIYALMSLIDECKDDGLDLEVSSSNSVESAFKIENSCEIDLWITDLDLGSQMPNGIALVRQLREMGSRAQICVHSNQKLLEDHQLALRAGADTFIPKPMRKVDLKKLFRKILSDVSKASREAVKNARLVVVDDDPFIREIWTRQAASGFSIRTFATPEEFWKECNDDASFTLSIEYIITDFFFASKGTGITGDEFAKVIKRRLNLPVFVASDHLSLEHGENIFTGSFPKDPSKAMAGLREYLNAKGRVNDQGIG
jgi:CheY-like chemotaxis protein